MMMGLLKKLNEKYITQISIIFLFILLFFLFITFSEYGTEMIDWMLSDKIVSSIVLSLALSFFVLLIIFLFNIIFFIRQKRICVKAHNNTRKFRSEILRALDLHRDLFGFIDSKFKFSWANTALLNLDKNIIGSPVLNEFFLEEELHSQSTIIHKSLETQKPETIIKYYPPNTIFKEEKYLEHTCTPIFDYDNNISHLFLISQDVTTRTQLEDAKGHLSSIINASEDAIFVVDKNGILHSWNDGAEKMFGYSADQILGQPVTILDHYVNFEILISIIYEQNIKYKKGIQHIDNVQINRLDKQYFVSFTIYPFFDDAGEILGVSTIVRDKTEAVLSQKAIIESERQMRNLALHIDKVLEEERKQIAFAIHDELGYALSSIKRDITWLKDIAENNGEINRRRMEDMVNLVDTTIKKVKSISLNLRPSVLDHFGLAAAIEWQAGEFQRRMATRCRVTLDPPDFDVKEELKIPIFRIFQEALTNITRYAKASRVDVVLTLKNNFLNLKVIDNGVGIPQEKINDPNSFGLLGIREKAASIGGIAKISRNPEGGTCVSLQLEIND